MQSQSSGPVAISKNFHDTVLEILQNFPRKRTSVKSALLPAIRLKLTMKKQKNHVNPGSFDQALQINLHLVAYIRTASKTTFASSGKTKSPLSNKELLA